MKLYKKSTIKRLLGCLLPKIAYNRLLTYIYERRTKKHHRKQSPTQITIQDYILSIPNKHALLSIQSKQPRRDLAIGIAAKLISEKYPSKTILDIGANIGDTAAIIASQCKADLVLVEASDYFFEYLKTNAALFKNNKTTIIKSFVSDGKEEKGWFKYPGSTAYFDVNDGGNLTIKTKKLDELAKDVCFVKIDTDGHDFKIISGNSHTLHAWKPLVMFECQIRSADEYRACIVVFETLKEIGYSQYCFFDDQGYLLLATNNEDNLRQLINFMKQQSLDGVRCSISNYDIYCFHNNDLDLADRFISRVTWR